jgi:hypothetical protein
MINVKDWLRVACVPAGNERPALVTDTEREATLLLLAFVGMCSFVAVSIIVMMLLAVAGFGALSWWLLS